MRMNVGVRGVGSLKTIAVFLPARQVLSGLFFLLVWAPSLVGAEEIPVRTQRAHRTEDLALRVEGGRILLTREEVLALALERNLGLQTSRVDRAKGTLGVIQAQGIFDLGLSSQVSFLSDENPAASNLDGAQVQEQRRSSWSLGLSRLLPWGGTAAVQWSTFRLETNSRFALLNPSYSAGLDLTLSQPLLRGFGREATEASIEIAKVNDGLSRNRFELEVTALIQATENAYWALVGAKAQLTVAEQALALARELHQNNQVRVEVGTLAPLELVQSEAGIAARQEEILRARAAVLDAEDALRSLLDLPPGELWQLPIEPQSPVDWVTSTVPLEEALALAGKQRLELQAQEEAIRVFEIERRLREQETKPQLNLTVNYGWNGVGGKALVRNPDGTIAGVSPGGLEDAWEQIARADFPGWSIGFDFRYPLENRTGRARAALAALDVERAQSELNRLKVQVATEVRAALRGVETARQQIESARVSVALEEQNLEAEQKRFENGLSTSFQVLQVQERLTAARSRLVAAQTQYRRALVEYHRAVGDLLKASNVRILDQQSSLENEP